LSPNKITGKYRILTLFFSLFSGEKAVIFAGKTASGFSIRRPDSSGSDLLVPHRLLMYSRPKDISHRINQS